MNTSNVEDTAVILIDHQVGTNNCASTTPLALLQRNVIILAKFAKGMNMPTVLTSSQETNINVQGPLMPKYFLKHSLLASNVKVSSTHGMMKISQMPVATQFAEIL